MSVWKLYRSVISPVLHASGLGVCRFVPSCSEYAEVAFHRHGPFTGLRLSLTRILRCHPWSTGGLDNVPESPGKRFAVTCRVYHDKGKLRRRTAL